MPLQDLGLVTHDGDTMKAEVDQSEQSINQSEHIPGLSVEQHHVPVQHVTLHLVTRLQVLCRLLSVAILEELPTTLIALACGLTNKNSVFI